MAVEFEHFPVQGARIYYGAALPLGLRVMKSKDDESDAPPPEESTETLKTLSQSGKITELLDRHGVVLISGIGHPSPVTFATLVNTIEKARGSHPHEQVGPAGKRTVMGENVWSANEGGATPIAHGEVVLERVLAEILELVEGIEKRGLAIKMLFRAPGNEGKHDAFNWAGQYCFGQEFQPGDDEELKRVKAEKQVRRLTDDFRWLDDGSLELTQHIPGLRRHSVSERPLWFNGLVGRHGLTRDIGALDPPHKDRDGMTYLPCVYGDETPFPREFLDKLIDVIDQEEIYLPLSEGDLLLVDNFRVSHAREPWERNRLVLVSMWDGAHPSDQGLLMTWIRGVENLVVKE